MRKRNLDGKGLHTNLQAMKTEHTDRNWIIVRIDGKIAAVSTDYRMLASISAQLAQANINAKSGKSNSHNGQTDIYKEITATTTDFEEVWRLRQEVGWDDLLLFGTDFQKKVWRKLWELTHGGEIPGRAGDDGKKAGDDGKKAGDDGKKAGDDGNTDIRLVSYTDFAELCQNRAGVRAVAHAIGLNPISVIIPCHLVIPKESIDKMDSIKKKAEATIFKGDDLCLSSILKDGSIDFGEYSLGRDLKRKLITLELTGL